MEIDPTGGRMSKGRVSEDFLGFVAALGNFGLVGSIWLTPSQERISRKRPEATVHERCLVKLPDPDIAEAHRLTFVRVSLQLDTCPIEFLVVSRSGISGFTF